MLAAFGELFGLDETSALKIACGFGAGCGRLGLTCGAVTGAFMVISLKHGKVRADDNPAKEKTYALVQEFSRQFVLRNQTTNCTQLLGCDLGTPEGLAHAKRTRIADTVCPTVIRDAAEILEGMLAEEVAG